MERGQRVIEVATGRPATIVFSWPHGTDSHAEPWAKIMFALTKEEGYGVSFACRDLAELRLESDPWPEPTEPTHTCCHCGNTWTAPGEPTDREFCTADCAEDYEVKQHGATCELCSRDGAVLTPNGYFCAGHCEGCPGNPCNCHDQPVETPDNGPSDPDHYREWAAQQPTHVFRVQRGSFDARVLISSSAAVALQEHGWVVWARLDTIELNLRTLDVRHICRHCGTTWPAPAPVDAQTFCSPDCASEDALVWYTEGGRLSFEAVRRSAQVAAR